MRTGGNKSKHSRKTSVQTDPRHQLPAPYSKLLTLGYQEDLTQHSRMAEELQKGDVAEAVTRLEQIALDESYYRYLEGEDAEGMGQNSDPRAFARVNALRVLMHLGPAIHSTLDSLLTLLDEEDDYIREDLPLVFSAIGPAAISVLKDVLQDEDENEMARVTASSCLAQIGEDHPDHRSEIIEILKNALTTVKSVDLKSYLITDLMDLNAREAYPEMEAACKNGEVDPFLIDLDEIREFFGMDVEKSPEELRDHRRKLLLRETGELDDEDEDVDAVEQAEQVKQNPYVSEEKPGRNDPCPCGSGKKYKKCCGG